MISDACYSSVCYLCICLGAGVVSPSAFQGSRETKWHKPSLVHGIALSFGDWFGGVKLWLMMSNHHSSGRLLPLLSSFSSLPPVCRVLPSRVRRQRCSDLALQRWTVLRMTSSVSSVAKTSLHGIDVHGILLAAKTAICLKDKLLSVSVVLNPEE